jgi:hypothetical protein
MHVLDMYPPRSVSEMPMRKTSYWRDPKVAEHRNSELDRVLPSRQRPRKAPKERAAAKDTDAAGEGTKPGDSDRRTPDLRQA